MIQPLLPSCLFLVREIRPAGARSPSIGRILAGRESGTITRSAPRLHGAWRCRCGPC